MIRVGEKLARVAHRRGSPTALCLHGYPDTHRVFDRFLARLDPSWGFVAPDFPGQGRSEPSDAFSPEACAQWVVSLLDVLEVDRVHVFAHDMGAHTALQLALDFPARVERLVISHALLDAHAPTSHTIALLRRGRAYRAMPLFPRAVVARALSSFLPPDAPLSREVREDIISSFDRRVAASTARVCDAAETWLARGLDRFASLRLPVDLVWGSAESHFPRAHAESLARVVPAKITDIPGGHHWLAWQRPDAWSNCRPFVRN